MANYEDDDLDNIDDQDVDGGEAAEGGQARTGGNRNFIIAAGILGGIFLLLVVALLVVALVVLPQRRAQQNAANDVIATQNAESEAQATQAAAAPNAQLLTPSVTPTITLTPVPPTPTFTQVVARATDTQAAPSTVSPTPLDARTATVAALLTQAAEAKITRTITATGAAGGGVITSTTLPKTGFADEVGLPGLFGLSLVLIAVIVLVRRLRLSASS